MSARKLRGYAVRVGDMWIKPGPGGSIALSSSKADRHLFADAMDAGSALADVRGRSLGVVVPVFAVRKPKPAPSVESKSLDVQTWSRHLTLRHPSAGDEGKVVVFNQGSFGTRVERLTKVEPHMCWFGTVQAEGTRGSEGFEVSRCYVVAEPKPAPVVAAEGRYAVLSERGPRAGFQGWGPVSDEDFIGTREQAMRVALVCGMSVVRVLPDGEHEAACEAARREERERALADLRERVRLCLDGSDHPEASHAFEHALDIVDDEEKGQAK